MKEMGLAEKKKEMNMQRVMHDALHYFEKNGYYNTSIDKLCKGAMISRSSFFNYFGCKEKIIELIVADGLKDYKEFTYKEMEDPKDAEESLIFISAPRSNTGTSHRSRISWPWIMKCSKA